MKGTEMLLVSVRGVNHGCLASLQDETPISSAVKALFGVACTRRNEKHLKTS